MDSPRKSWIFEEAERERARKARRAKREAQLDARQERAREAAEAAQRAANAPAAELLEAQAEKMLLDKGLPVLLDPQYMALNSRIKRLRR